MDRIKQLTQPGDTITYAVGSTTITLTVTVDHAYSRTVFSGPNRVEALCTIHTDEHLARGAARCLAAGLKAGMSIHQFAADAATANTAVVTEAEGIVDAALRTALADPRTVAAEPTIAALQQAMPAGDTNELAARINADFDAAVERARTEQAQINDDIARIVAEGPGWYGYRKSIAQTVPNTGRTNVPAVVAKPLSAEQETLLIAALAEGVVDRNADCTNSQIIALERRGLVERVRDRVGNGWYTVGMRLTPAGVRRAEQIAQRVTR